MPKTSLRKQPQKKKKTSRVYWYLLAATGLGILFIAGGFTFAATQEQRDSFCASCHTQPESTFYQREQAQPVDLASSHKTKDIRCIDCHSGTGITGRIQAELLGAHNALALYTGTAIQPAKQTVPIDDQNCLKCHANISQAETMENHFHYFLPRWQSVDHNAAKCVSCHSGHTLGGNAEQAFLGIDRTRQQCESCHAKLQE